MKNPLLALRDQGQAVWLDNLHHGLIVSGELLRLIEEDGVAGLTSNPAIFEKAITGTQDYQDLLTAPESQGLDGKSLYERIAVRDIQGAADVLAPVYVKSRRRDGYVSLEVSPKLASDVQGTLEEARRLWLRVARENLMIKVPGTPEGIIAFQQLISEGINVNVTLLFSPKVYGQVATAYMAGLESYAAKEGELARVGSVASFFISRIDTAIDRVIAERLNTPQIPHVQGKLLSLLGKVAIASAKAAHQKYLEMLAGERWQQLSRHGAQTQRLLWASTGRKNPGYSDVKYVEELIGQDTVNTMPPATLDAFRDHGRVSPTLGGNLEEAAHVLSKLEEVGISFEETAAGLLADGLGQFAKAFGKLLKVTDRRAGSHEADSIDFLRVRLFEELYNGGKNSRQR